MIKWWLGCSGFHYKEWLPSRIPYTMEMLQRIIEALDRSFDNVVEFHDTGWWNEEVYKQLKKSGISFCGISHPKLPDEMVKNTPVLYFRFHGVPVLYKSEYEIDFVKKIEQLSGHQAELNMRMFILIIHGALVE